MVREYYIVVYVVCSITTAVADHDPDQTYDELRWQRESRGADDRLGEVAPVAFAEDESTDNESGNHRQLGDGEDVLHDGGALQTEAVQQCEDPDQRARGQFPASATERLRRRTNRDEDTIGL